MRIDSENNRILVRQSWIGDALLCAQRAKYAMTYTDLRTGSDATAIGTGIHASIEKYLNGEIPDSISFHRNIREEVGYELAKDIKLTKISNNPDIMWKQIESMATAWWDDIRPSVLLGGATEYKFKAPLSIYADNGMEIWLEGTIDYVSPDGTLWDWKTAGRAYGLREKHEQSHQATCYITALRALGIIPDTDEASLFRFGVMIRQSSPKAQILTVSRDKGQTEFLRRQIKSILDTAIKSWDSADWVINDQHFLCTQTWCDYWTMCKGAHWTDEACQAPSQIVTPVTVTITEVAKFRDTLEEVSSKRIDNNTNRIGTI